jgi:hypothetical protein
MRILNNINSRTNVLFRVTDTLFFKYCFKRRRHNGTKEDYRKAKKALSDEFDIVRIINAVRIIEVMYNLTLSKT